MKDKLIIFYKNHRASVKRFIFFTLQLVYMAIIFKVIGTWQ